MKLKLNALTDSEISHKDCKTIVDEKEKQQKMKEKLRMIESQKIDAKNDELNEEEGEKIETNKIIRGKNKNP